MIICDRLCICFVRSPAVNGDGIVADGLVILSAYILQRVSFYVADAGAVIDADAVAFAVRDGVVRDVPCSAAVVRCCFFASSGKNDTAVGYARNDIVCYVA